MTLSIRVALLGCLLASWPALALSEDLPVKPFQARYEVYGSGFSIGEAVMSLNLAGDAYQMSTRVRPNGLAAMLVSGQIDEQASGEIREGAIRPIRYERRVETPKKKQTVQLRFDWSAKQIQASDNERRATLPLSSGVMDPLSLNLQAMWDLQNGRAPTQYVLADETELKTYQIKNEGEETLDTSVGKLRAIRLSQAKPGKTRITTFWFAPPLHYLPVRVMQQKDNKEVLRMEIRAVER
ncbi:MAG TPA: DUF3108 domain-containing protein [Candidatus Competibacter sp.]|nr:DUF3108 domain-containing protein [Candidatus Competibacter sp.]HUM93573.1 DUF3108 domain-containing protein [Candidatus Competibacter sp.]